MRTTLPVLAGGELCEGCGRCCDKIGLPPFEVPNPDLGPMPVWGMKRLWSADDNTRAADQFLTDTDTFLRMPAALRADHARLVRGLKADPSERPCAWLDPDTKRCSHYEFRPAVCRDWEPGTRECLSARGGRGVVVWRDDNAPANWRNPRRERATPWADVVRRIPTRLSVRPRRGRPVYAVGTDGVLAPKSPAWRRGPVWWAVLALAAVAAGPWLAWRTARESRRGWRAVRDLWATPCTDLPSAKAARRRPPAGSPAAVQNTPHKQRPEHAQPDTEGG